MLVRRALVVLGLSCLSILSGLTMESVAAEPPAFSIGRTTVLYLRKGSTEAANFRTLNAGASDRFIVVLVGTGQARLTVGDADEAGDTVNVSGSIQSALTTTFDQSATSPDQISQPILVTGYGVLTFNVRYSSVVNPTPNRYFYNLKF